MGPTVTRPVLDSLAVILLDNGLCILKGGSKLNMHKMVVENLHKKWKFNFKHFHASMTQIECNASFFHILIKCRLQSGFWFQGKIVPFSFFFLSVFLSFVCLCIMFFFSFISLLFIIICIFGFLLFFQYML